MIAERLFASLIDLVVAAVVAGATFGLVISTGLFRGANSTAAGALTVGVIFFFARALPVIVFHRTLGERLLKIRRFGVDGRPVGRVEQLLTLPRYARHTFQHWD